MIEENTPGVAAPGDDYEPVLGLQKPMDMLLSRRPSRPIEIRSGRDVEVLALSDPDEYQRLLNSYFLLLGPGQLWWQACSEADDLRWSSCIRNAIAKVAKTTNTDPERLADLLDDVTLPLTRRRVMRIAREHLYGVRNTG